MTHQNESPDEFQDVKILLIGDAGVGKSSLARRFAEEEASESPVTTIGVDFKVRYFQLSNDRKFKVALWDTAGAEKFRSLTANYYRGVHAYILVYDVSDTNTFSSLNYWIQQVDWNATNKTAVKLIIANKIDQSNEVNSAQGTSFAAEHAALYLETSAETGVGVEFAACAHRHGSDGYQVRWSES
ncbi:nucleoside triphosphate phosphatase [Perkinsus sp. BL_2016]|nr:nucleoside triphosphate phosphatase [Perkinsus sp. BL_2016]